MNLIYIGSGETANNKNRLDTHLYELLYKVKKGEPLTRKLFEAVNEIVLNISIFYDIIKLSLNDFLNSITQNLNLSFTTIKDNVKYTTLKELEKKNNN